MSTLFFFLCFVGYGVSEVSDDIEDGWESKKLFGVEFILGTLSIMVFHKEFVGWIGVCLLCVIIWLEWKG